MNTAKIFQKRVFLANTILFRQGENTKEMYILNEGKLEIIVDGNAVAKIVQRGVFFGELAFILNEPRAATIRTLTQCECLVIPAEYIQSALEFRPEIGFKLIKILAKRLKQTTNSLSHLYKNHLQLALKNQGRTPTPPNINTPYEMMKLANLVSESQLLEAAKRFKKKGKTEDKSFLQYVQEESGVEMEDLLAITSLFKKYH